MSFRSTSQIRSSIQRRIKQTNHTGLWHQTGLLFVTLVSFAGYLFRHVCYLSACYSVETVYASLGIAVLTIVYDELGGHVHWVNRSTLLPVGYAFFEVGACLVASKQPTYLVIRQAVLIIFPQALTLTNSPRSRLRPC